MKAFFTLFLMLLVSSTQAEATRPNIVLILADDLGWTDLGCYGSSFYETPNIDRLAAEGVRFTDAYAASPVCSPTRASLLTGRYPARTQVTDWIPGRTPPGAKLKIPLWTNFLRHEETTIAELLKEGGYATASIGKWHLGREGYFPENHGFDVNFAGEQWGSHGSMFAPHRNNQPAIAGSPAGEYLTDRLTDEAIKFIEQNQEKPFFLYLPHYAVHTPVQGKPALVEKYKRKQASGSHDNAEYAAMLESMDDSVGRIVTKLDDLGLSQRTIVIFFSDNGGLETQTSNAPLREGKGTAYEGGIRVPLIVKWPRVARAGAVSSTPVHSNDLFPTLATAAGVNVPQSLAIDGHDLKPLLVEGELQRENLFWHYPHYNAHTPINTCAPHGIIRQGDWKLIEFFEDGRLELFNLKNDPAERNNLAAKEPKLALRLVELLQEWRRSVRAQMPEPNPDADAAVFREFKEKRLWKPVGRDYKQHTSFKAATSANTNAHPNVLFIAIDDLRTNLGCYGDKTAMTPNIDRLAKSGVLFERAYCQQAVCNPSRQSLLTGRRPDTIRVWNLADHFRNTAPDLVTLPQYFKNHGYFAQSFGKIYHGDKEMNDAQSWSVPEQFAFAAKIEDYGERPDTKAPKKNKEKLTASRIANNTDDDYPDGKVAFAAVEALRTFKSSGTPFFLAVGFRKPHLPFSAPKRYWDLYKREKIPLPDPVAPPKDVPPIALHDWVELRGYSDMPGEGPLTREQVQELRHGYYAATSFMDAQVGKVLDELERLELDQNTIVVLWSDHGFHLGEQGLWCKASNFELDARVPLIIRNPQQKVSNARTAGLVELVDLYPTLVELCGLPVPAGLDGASFALLFSDLNRPGKEAAFTQFPRPWELKKPPQNMGYSVRTANFRYVEWVHCASGEIVARELYDLSRHDYESVNLADNPEYRTELNRHSQLAQTARKQFK